MFRGFRGKYYVMSFKFKRLVYVAYFTKQIVFFFKKIFFIPFAGFIVYSGSF